MRANKRFLLPAIIILIALALPAQARNSRLSGVVAFQKQETAIQEWLSTPTEAFVEAQVRFSPTLADSVIFGVDQEYLDGMHAPHHLAGGDWMGLVGLQRSGKVWVAAGTEATEQGSPSKERNWVVLDIGHSLQPDTWYRINTVADFATRHYVSLTISGPNLHKEFDLSAYRLDYPNMMPFDGRSMTDYVWAMNGTAIGGTPEADAKVYFDDLRAGVIESASGKQTERDTFTDDFEAAKLPLEQPIHWLDMFWTKQIALKPYNDKVWYLERDEALAKPVQAPFARSGKIVMLVDAALQDISFLDWVNK